MKLFTQSCEYVAGGKTVSLRPDGDFVGVHLDQLDASLRRKLEKGAQRVGPGLAVVPGAALPDKDLQSLHEKGLVFPVFTGGGAQVIALPEVRVELPAGKPAADGFPELQEWLRARAGDIKILSQSPDRLVLAPASGYGPDAVELAGDIARKFKGLSASPRLVRIVARPK